jgi:hypothetical protein
MHHGGADVFDVLPNCPTLSEPSERSGSYSSRHGGIMKPTTEERSCVLKGVTVSPFTRQAVVLVKELQGKKVCGG